MQVIIRDDDTSFFTCPEMLETVYEQAWKLDIPVCLSVIPAHSSVELEQEYIRERFKSLYDLNVPPAYRGTNKTFLINANQRLCSFLNKKINDGLVEVAIHGYRHAMEFQREDKNAVRRTLAQGATLLRTCFPSASLNTFVAPYEILATAARDVILESGYNISTTYDAFYSNNFLRYCKYQIRKKIVSEVPRRTVELKGESKIFFGFNSFLPDIPVSQCLDKAVQTFDECKSANKVFVCINHYWYFFKDWAEPREDLLAAWLEFIKYSKSFPDVEWITYNRYSLKSG